MQIQTTYQKLKQNISYLTDDNKYEINFFELESVTDTCNQVLAECATLAKICHILKIQAKEISKGNDDLYKELALSKQDAKRLEPSINTLENELLISRKERDKSVQEHKTLVKNTTIV
ncbi:hypothetical protein V8G54_036268 [Vigna mungo]|uniref:Uncharacterized protein n=1 Tax=Vigna mungo TaxID=3915 RepID=A0AAQ3MGV0_VIGMU